MVINDRFIVGKVAFTPNVSTESPLSFHSTLLLQFYRLWGTKDVQFGFSLLRHMHLRANGSAPKGCV
jgi:hypothetical protein